MRLFKYDCATTIDTGWVDLVCAFIPTMKPQDHYPGDLCDTTEDADVAL